MCERVARFLTVFIAKYCDERVCMSVCPCLSRLSARISHKPDDVQTSRSLLYMLPEAVDRSSSDDNAIMIRIYGFVDNAMFVHNRPRTCDANRVYTESDSVAAASGRSLVCTLALFGFYAFRGFMRSTYRTYALAAEICQKTFPTDEFVCRDPCGIAADRGSTFSNLLASARRRRMTYDWRP